MSSLAEPMLILRAAANSAFVIHTLSLMSVQPLSSSPRELSLAQRWRVVAARLKRRVITYLCVWPESWHPDQLTRGAGAPPAGGGPMPVKLVQVSFTTLQRRDDRKLSGPLSGRPWRGLQTHANALRGLHTSPVRFARLSCRTGGALVEFTALPTPAIPKGTELLGDLGD